MVYRFGKCVIYHHLLLKGKNNAARQMRDSSLKNDGSTKVLISITD